MSKKVFNCKRCGKCCEGRGGIVVSLEEQEKIAAFLQISLSEFQSKYVETLNGKSQLKVEKNFCIFFKPEKGCSIHTVKPKVCQAWPFFRGNLVDKVALNLAKEYCPGINPNISFQAFKEYGLTYLKQHNLLVQDVDGPTALKVYDLLK